MTHVFAPNQEVAVHHTCEVIGYILRRGLKGTVLSVTDSLGEPIFRVNFGRGVLPMREAELTPANSPLPDDDASD
jgi:hypothetical protein